MRKYIDILNETLAADATPVNEPEMLEEGVRETLEAIVDKTLKLFSPRHVSYEAACAAIDKVNAITDTKLGKPYMSYTKDDLMVGGKLVQDVAATVVGLSMTLTQVQHLGMDVTSQLVAAASAAVAFGLVHSSNGKRALTMDQARRYGVDTAAKSPAPRNETYESVMTNIAAIMKK